MKKIMDALGGDYAGIQTPVWRNEEELAVIAKALAAVGAVGSLVLHPTLNDLDMVLDKTWQEIWDAFSVVHQDGNGTLDKTWQEIHDGMPAIIIADDGDETSFIVTVGSMADNTAYTDNYVASSASGYPTLAG